MFKQKHTCNVCVYSPLATNKKTFNVLIQKHLKGNI